MSFYKPANIITKAKHVFGGKEENEKKSFTHKIRRSMFLYGNINLMIKFQNFVNMCYTDVQFIKLCSVEGSTLRLYGNCSPFSVNNIWITCGNCFNDFVWRESPARCVVISCIARLVWRIRVYWVCLWPCDIKKKKLKQLTGWCQWCSGWKN